MNEQLDCLDFCLWSLGQNYCFENYVAPEGVLYMPSLEELIDEESSSNRKEFNQ